MKAKRSCLACWLLVCSSVGLGQTKILDAIRDESSVTYRLKHPLHRIEATSKDVHYALEVDTTTKEIKRVSAAVDVTTFDSGNSNRDSHAMEVIDAITYPDARFVSTSIAQDDDTIHVAGKLTFHGVTHNVTVAGRVKWSEKKITMEGGFAVSLEAFEIERPALLMIPVGDVLSFSIAAAFEW